jgi:hypothetical protein
MIDLKEAIERAKQFIAELNGEPEQFQVEEIMLSEDKKNWLVTVSYFKKIKSPNELQKTLGLEGQIAYKRVVVDSENENIVGMLNWSYDRREAV